MNTTYIPTEHRETIVRLYKGGNVLLPQFTEADIDIWHAATGIATEAGELIQAVLPMQLANNFTMGRTALGGSGRHVDPWDGNDGAPGVDIYNIKEELGDHLFYEGALRIVAGLENITIPDLLENRCKGTLELHEPISDGLWPHPVGPLTYANHPDVGRKRVLTDLIMIHAGLAGEILDVAKRVAIYRKGFEDVPEGGISLKDRLKQHLIDDCWVVGQFAVDGDIFQQLPALQ